MSGLPQVPGLAGSGTESFPRTFLKIVLNVLRLTDLAEVAGLVAPREIVTLSKLPETFRYTSAIFGLYGKRGQMREAQSLAEALRVWETPKLPIND